MELNKKSISALPLALADKKARSLSQGELNTMDTEMRQIETVTTLLAFEWGYRFYIGCLKDEDGIKNYKKIGWNSQDEWIATFKSIKRRTAFNRKKVYRLWAMYLYNLPIKTFFEVGTSKIITIAKEIEKHAGDEEKLTELLDEAADLSRRKLEMKYRNKNPKIWLTGEINEFYKNHHGSYIMSVHKIKFDPRWDISPQNFYQNFGHKKGRARMSIEIEAPKEKEDD